MRRDSHNQNHICSLFCVFSLSFLGYLWSDLIQTPQRVTLNYFEYTTGDFSRLCVRALVRINDSVLCKKQGKEISRNVRGFSIYLFVSSWVLGVKLKDLPSFFFLALFSVCFVIIRAFYSFCEFVEIMETLGNVMIHLMFSCCMNVASELPCSFINSALDSAYVVSSDLLLPNI